MNERVLHLCNRWDRLVVRKSLRPCQWTPNVPFPVENPAMSDWRSIGRVKTGVRSGQKSCKQGCWLIKQAKSWRERRSQISVSHHNFPTSWPLKTPYIYATLAPLRMGNAKKEASRRERKSQTKEFANVKVKVRNSTREFPH